MTLYDYLASLVVDGTSLVWSDKPLSASQITAASGKPYVYVEELQERPTVPMYGNQDVVMGTVDCLIFQAPTSQGTAPIKTDMTKLYFDLYDATKNVDEWTYGQPLIAIHRELGLPPRFDQDTGGNMAMIRFRLLFPRG